MDDLEHKSTISDLSKRFFIAIERIGYTGYQISKEVDGISQQTLTHIRNGRNAPSVKVIGALLKKFPSINANWLLTGEGHVLLEEISIGETTDKQEADTEIEAPYFVKILNELTVDEIITYIQRYEKTRGFGNSEMFKMFLEIHTERKLHEKLEDLQIQVKELSKIIAEIDNKR